MSKRKISPQELLRLAKTARSFMCDICQDRCPESLGVEQDGALLCPNCASPTSLTERLQLRANENAANVRKSAEHARPLKKPGLSHLAGIGHVTDFSPKEVLFTRPLDGAPITVTLTGIGLSASDVVAFVPDNGISTLLTASSYTPSADGTSATVSVAAHALIPNGYYDFYFNETRYPNVIRVF